MPYSQRSIWVKVGGGWVGLPHRTKKCGSGFGKDSRIRPQPAVRSNLLE